jgi:NAD(P)-dependent dehydrogenase (short-subunit alcohol dehydrogenase family)
MEVRTPSLSLENRSTIVTGAGNGLGLAIARRLARGGARVFLVDRDPVVLERIGSSDLPGETACALVKDLADEDAARVVFAEALKTFGAIDTLINNAAWSFHRPMLEVTSAEFDRLIAINQRAPFFLAQEFLRHVSSPTFRSSEPAIVNVASVNALVGNAELVPYAGTKGALAAMTRAMAVEMAPFGIRVNTISPSAVDTFVTRSLVADGTIELTKLFAKRLVKRFASCEEVAELVSYLCSPAGAYVNGAHWVIDGGYTAQ